MSDVQWHKTACNLCYVNCGIEVMTDGSSIVRVREGIGGEVICFVW